MASSTTMIDDNMNSSSEKVVVDAHVHLWEIKRFPYAWPTPEGEAAICRDVNPAEYATDVRDTPFRNAIFVQALNKNYPENEWVYELAKNHPWIVGVVGWVDLTDPKVEIIIENASKNPLFLGIRHIIDFESPDWLRRADVHNGLKVLERLDLTFDFLLRPPTLHYASELAAKFPKLRFVLDHMAKPYIKDQIMEGWKEGIVKAAQHPNVYCKLSGAVTEADPNNWKTADIKPYIEHCVKHFGAKRCIFGSDFPVFKMVGATYSDIYQLMMECLMDCTTAEEREGIFGRNALDIYRIKVPLNK